MGKERDDVLGVPVAMSPAPGGDVPGRQADLFTGADEEGQD
jgi:hypothetical protein